MAVKSRRTKFLDLGIAMKEISWDEIETRMAKYLRQIEGCSTEREAIPLIEQAGRAYENMKLRLPDAWKYGRNL